MNKSESVSKLAAALVKAQAEMPVVLFDAKNPFLKNDYATLGAIISATKPILAKNGLSITQFPYSQEGRVGVTSILLHESGEYIENTITLVPEGKGVSVNQAAGITITYLRRYAWAAICGTYGDEDSDGANSFANEKVSEIMNADKNTGEIQMIREWSLEQLEEAYKETGETNEDYDYVTHVLNLSVLPANAPLGTIKSWVGRYMKSDGSDVTRAQAANEAYISAKTKKTGGKK